MNNVLPANIRYYNLRPEESQPTGTVNFSAIDNIILTVDTVSIAISEYSTIKRTKIIEYINDHTATNESNIECSICLCENTPKHRFVKTECGHIFHKRCLEKWLYTNKNTCPLCREKIL